MVGPRLVMLDALDRVTELKQVCVSITVVWIMLFGLVWERNFSKMLLPATEIKSSHLIAPLNSIVSFIASLRLVRNSVASSASVRLDEQQHKEEADLLDGTGWSFKFAKKDKQEMEKRKVPAQVTGFVGSTQPTEVSFPGDNKTKQGWHGVRPLMTF